MENSISNLREYNRAGWRRGAIYVSALIVTVAFLVFSVLVVTALGAILQ